MIKIDNKQINNLEIGDIIETNLGNLYLIVEDLNNQITLINIEKYKQRNALFRDLDELVKIIRVKRVFKNNDLLLGE